MRRFFLKWLFLTASFLLSAVLAPAWGQSQAPVRQQAPLFFRNAVSQFYQVPEEQVALAGREKIKDEELPVLFLIVQRSRSSLEKVIELREKGASWLTTARHFGVTPEIFYVSLKNADGAFRKPLGFYKNRKKSLWKKIVLRDKDIVDLVDLKFLSDFYKHAPDQIAGWYVKGKSFVDINAELQARVENQ